MADNDNPSSSARRRNRSSEASARSEALERLKALRGGNRNSSYQVRLETPIYDTVDEDEYESLVARRREEAQSFIVDDEGLGYGDEGEEEDWSKAGMPPSSDEDEDGERERPKRKKEKEKEKEKKEEVAPRKVSSSLSAAAAMMGKQRLSNMFTSSVFKKSKGVAADSIVDDVIAEFAPDEGDRERRRRGQLRGSNGVGVKSESKTVNGFGLSSGNESGGASGKGNEAVELGSGAIGVAMKTEENGGSVGETEVGKDLNSEVAVDSIVKSASDDLSGVKGGVVEEKMLDSVDEVKKEQEVVVKKEDVRALNARITDVKDPALSATAGWQAMKSVEGGSIGSIREGNEEKLDFETDGDGSLPFHILDAYEEIYGANMGTLYLFGKVIWYFLYHVVELSESS